MVLGWLVVDAMASDHSLVITSDPFGSHQEVVKYCLPACADADVLLFPDWDWQGVSNDRV